MLKADPNDNKMPCLMCEKPLETPEDCKHETIDPTMKNIKYLNFKRGVHCCTYGNYGSQVLDLDREVHFAICDACMIRHSNKMLSKPSRETIEASTGLINTDMVNAREHYELWFSQIEKANSKDDQYVRDIKPYFK